MSDPADLTAAHFIQPGEQTYELDKGGYLLNADCWRREFAEYMAAKQGLKLSPECWQCIDFARKYYFRYDDSPPMRSLVNWAGKALGAEKGSSRYLYRLFPAGPGKQVSLLAGLPKPVSCI